MNCTNRLRLSATVILLAMTTMIHAQKGNLENIADLPHLSAYLVAALLIAVFVMIFYNRLYYYREREVNTQVRHLNTQLALVLHSSKTQVWTYDLTKRLYTLLSDQGEAKKEYTPIDFAQFFNNDDFNDLRKIIADIEKKEDASNTMLVRGKAPSDEKTTQHIYEVNISVLQRDEYQKPKILIGIQRDITEELERQKRTRELSLRYHTVFNTSLIDMIYYDADGIMNDINEKACESFRVGDRQQLLMAKPSITEVPAMEGIDFRKIDNLHSSSITELNQIEKPIGSKDKELWGNKIYYEQTLSSLRNQNGELSGIVMAGRNITEMVLSQHHQKEASLLLQKATKNIQNYINNINYSLKVSGVRLINYYPDTHVLEISSDLNKAQYRLSQIRCASLINTDDRRKCRGLFSRMDRRHPGIFTDTFHTLFHDEHGRDVYLTFNMVPLTDKDGYISHYFGMFRNTTEMIYTEQQLRQETKKARETEELKNTFLLNMSYEIRTPLNAVLGFAELFNNPHDEEDEPVFAEEIRRNTGELLALINDILFISRLDAKMVEFNYKENDFATLFDGYCYIGWSAISPGVKVSVENPYSRLMLLVDDQNLGTVIEKLCAHASQMTTEGTIRAKYEYRHGELNISIEDTGRGYGKEALAHIFDRFAHEDTNEHRGTGLEMPIIRELVEQMGGSIEVQSEEGKGCTVYVIIPCKMTSLEKKV